MTRLIRYLRRADIRRDPLRLLTRRALLEVERRFAPRRYRREHVVSIGDGLVMSVRPEDEIERAIYLFGLYEFVSATAFRRLIRAGSGVVDAGAHSGQYTLLASKRAGTVVAVEPNPDVRARLERNVRMNALTNVRVIGSALAQTAGRTTLSIPRGQNTGVAAVRAPRESERAVEIETETLDGLLERLGMRRLDVLKLDVEGMEKDVLQGGKGFISRDHPAILFEANDAYHGDPRTDATIAALHELGYELYEPAHLRKLAAGEDPRLHREYWQSLNLIALHPDRAAEFSRD